MFCGIGSSEQDPKRPAWCLAECWRQWLVFNAELDWCECGTPSKASLFEWVSWLRPLSFLAGMKRHHLRMKLLKRMCPNWRKRTNSATCCLLSATFHPACRRHISLKLLSPTCPASSLLLGKQPVKPMFLYPLSLGGRLVSMVTAAAGGGLLGPRFYEDHLAAITLEHMHCSCDLVCVQFSVSDNSANRDLLKRPALTCPSLRPFVCPPDVLPPLCFA